MILIPGLLFMACRADVPKSLDYLWFPSKACTRLVDVVDAPGCAVQKESDVVALLSSDGHQLKETRLPKSTAPLWYSKVDGLFLRQLLPIEGLSDDGTRHGVYDPVFQLFAQGNSVFVRSTGVTYLGPSSTFTFPHFDRLSGVGINPSRDVLALLSLPMSAPLVQIARRRDSDWSIDSFIRSPEIQGLGPCSILPRFNDLRFVSKDVFIFIGVFTTEVEAGKLAKFESGLIDMTDHKLEFTPGSAAHCYLFAMRISDGLTEGIAELAFHPSAERGGPRTGILSVSHDQSFVYILSDEGIMRLPTTEILKRVGS